MSETPQLLLLLAAIGLAGTGFVSIFLTFFIALQAPPNRRAAWTTGIAYLIVATGLSFSGLQGYEVVAQLVALPGALLVFLYWRMSFRRGWIADPENAPEGVKLENDDWRVGLVLIAAALLIAIGRKMALLLL